ncbi:MAG: hypothetical protein QM813_12795 [Verrucomicrobiota bacterium]
MQTIKSQTPGRTVTLVQTTTRTDGVARTDSLEISNTFVARANAQERRLYVEEDSTDVFLLERCSPLNDF